MQSQREMTIWIMIVNTSNTGVAHCARRLCTAWAAQESAHRQPNSDGSKSRRKYFGACQSAKPIESCISKPVEMKDPAPGLLGLPDLRARTLAAAARALVAHSSGCFWGGGGGVV